MQKRTYRYFEGDPLYPFGYGLSYTTFEYSNLKLSADSIEPGQSIDLDVTVENTGRVAADEVCFRETRKCPVVAVTRSKWCC